MKVLLTYLAVDLCQQRNGRQCQKSFQKLTQSSVKLRLVSKVEKKIEVRVSTVFQFQYCFCFYMKVVLRQLTHYCYVLWVKPNFQCHPSWRVNKGRFCSREVLSRMQVYFHSKAKLFRVLEIWAHTVLPSLALWCSAAELSESWTRNLEVSYLSPALTNS